MKNDPFDNMFLYVVYVTKGHTLSYSGSSTHIPSRQAECWWIKKDETTYQISLDELIKRGMASLDYVIKSRIDYRESRKREGHIPGEVKRVIQPGNPEFSSLTKKFSGNDYSYDFMSPDAPYIQWELMKHANRPRPIRLAEAEPLKVERVEFRYISPQHWDKELSDIAVGLSKEHEGIADVLYEAIDRVYQEDFVDRNDYAIVDFAKTLFTINNPRANEYLCRLYREKGRVAGYDYYFQLFKEILRRDRNPGDIKALKKAKSDFYNEIATQFDIDSGSLPGKFLIWSKAKKRYGKELKLIRKAMKQ